MRPSRYQCQMSLIPDLLYSTRIANGDGLSRTRCFNWMFASYKITNANRSGHDSVPDVSANKQDVFGPLDLVTMLSWQRRPSLYLISVNLEPVSTAVYSVAISEHNSCFSQSTLPTHSYDDAPHLDTLFLPDGIDTQPPTSTPPTILSEIPFSAALEQSVTARAGVLEEANKAARSFSLGS